MTIDVNQFHGVFFDESDEHLQDMEQLLMTLDVDAPDPEELNSIFRAAHSIKGGSGIFGFDALMNLTHVMENLLDKARNQEIQVTADIVDIFLQTLDVLKDTLSAYKEQTELPQEQIDASIKVLEDTLASASGQPVQEAQGSCEQHAEDETNEIEGFGFFDEDESEAQAQSENSADDIEGFGLFDDDATPTKAQTDAETNRDTSKVDEGFGFFEPENLPVKTEVSQSAIPKQPIVKPVKTKPKAATKEAASIRVDTTKIDAMVNLVGELVITQSMLSSSTTMPLVGSVMPSSTCINWVSDTSGQYWSLIHSTLSLPSVFTWEAVGWKDSITLSSGITKIWSPTDTHMPSTMANVSGKWM